MTTSEYETYWIPALDALKLRGSAFELDTLLGIGEFTVWYDRMPSEDTPMSDELKELLKKLAGPHGKALLRAYRIRKGLQDDNQ